MREAKLEPDVISYNVGISVCANGGQWQEALSMLRTMRLRKLDVNFMVYGTAASMCEQGGQGSQALSVFKEVRDLVAGE
eukprot:6298757-Pyramimonas_sp.AAC.1